MRRHGWVFHSSSPFADRLGAGRQLGGVLRKFRGLRPVVLGIPKGGMVVALELAKQLGGELDVIMTHKISAPQDPELAMAAVTETGKIFLNGGQHLFSIHDKEYLQRQRILQQKNLLERLAAYRKVLPKTSLRGRFVIVTDDGVATGFTMKAALWAARQEKPRRLVAAVPVGPASTVQKLSPPADEVVCLRIPDYFFGVSQYYVEFGQVTEEEVIHILKEEALRRPQTEAA